MTIKWGYRLPERSCARSHRFCYRSVAEHCLLMVLILNFDDHTCFNYFIFLRTYHTYVVLKFKVPRMRSFMVLSHSVIPKTAQLLARLPFLKVIVKEEWLFTSEIVFRMVPSAWLRFCGAMEGLLICGLCGYGAILLSTNSFFVSWIPFLNPIPNR